MMVLPFFFYICIDKLSKPLDADSVWFGSFFTPVPSGFNTHKLHIRKHIYNIVLNKVKIVSGFFPRRTKGYFKTRLKSIE
ncbi:hypothetical protein SDC9_57051 [bioreactor metagenome]|uniref:Uncharacterized protein n=1 Tax=bioreactor metagenome TaxID=1076179 RepID=A0A644X432_9ZZZZ